MDGFGSYKAQIIVLLGGVFTSEWDSPVEEVLVMVVLVFRLQKELYRFHSDLQRFPKAQLVETNEKKIIKKGCEYIAIIDTVRISLAGICRGAGGQLSRLLSPFTYSAKGL
jgi:hypothetical protein